MLLPYGLGGADAWGIARRDASRLTASWTGFLGDGQRVGIALLWGRFSCWCPIGGIPRAFYTLPREAVIVFVVLLAVGG